MTDEIQAVGKPSTAEPSSVRGVRMHINGQLVETEVESRLLLSDFLRSRAGLTGTHVGCEQGVCGACTVLLDGEAVRACLMLAVQANGCAIRTVEGLAGDELSGVQRAFHEKHGMQCGFCTPGFLMTVTALTERTERPGTTEVGDHLAGNLCRCTGYRNIRAAVSAALDERFGLEEA
jgi:carbon-monoxide dehydrogenase small subunit